ncbi:MauE/DoxX family redox-associated membrane protein [Ornithinimicrobium pekingense]|uniref:Methylamine utilisation protein MauE domain-containing protein n=1 Tax=Ornithinimicrobium pekingense TaxID=384677 RepID=A0ABQ2F3V6_9MICO|nr:MauE/DoxX family redox-associated membrane protein [Ornithinimicrobium pekingense]GGK58134.1 hypothetical protein GCM10011509_03190 [Ornithinimicrobium pekingense]
MSVLSPALLAAVGLVLAVAGVGHVRAPAELRSGLHAHGVLPGATHRAVALLLGPAELALGLAVLVVAAAGPVPGTALATGGAAAALLLALTAYLRRVLAVSRSAGRPVPCACGLGEAPVGPSTVARAAILTLMATVGGLTANGWSAPAAPLPEVLVVLAAALVLAVGTSLLPAARAVPEPAVRTRPPAPTPVSTRRTS